MQDREKSQLEQRPSRAFETGQSQRQIHDFHPQMDAGRRWLVPKPADTSVPDRPLQNAELEYKANGVAAAFDRHRVSGYRCSVQSHRHFPPFGVFPLIRSCRPETASQPKKEKKKKKF